MRPLRKRIHLIIMVAERPISTDVSLRRIIKPLSLEHALDSFFVRCSIDRSQLDLLTSLEPVSPDFGYIPMNEHLPQYIKAPGDI